MYSDILFPNKKILEIRFLSVEDFYTISFENNTYTIVGGDKDIETNLVGIAENEKVYYISADDKTICYISINISTFVKQLILFDDYVNTNYLPENPGYETLSEFADNFKSKILESDSDAFYNDNTFWSEVCEEMEYGII